MASSRTPLAPLIYLGLFSIAVVITLATAKETALAGIFLWILALPWNLVLGAILEKIVPGVFDHSIAPGLLISAISAIANVAILWFIESALKRRKTKV
jgi:hypothetical protein